MKSQILSTLAALASAGFALGQATTDPVGYTTVTCLSNSDTIVTVPLALPSVFAGTTGVPVDNANGTHSLTLSQDPSLSQVASDLYYAKILSGGHNGEYYEIINKSLGAVIVIDDQDVDLTDVTNGTSVEIIPFWTLVKLFPIGNTTIVASTGNLPGGRKTSILLPTVVSGAINLAPQQTFFFNGSTSNWRSTASGFPVSDNAILWPDSYLVIRHPSSAGPTDYVNTGTVSSDSSRIPLFTHATNPTDNFVSVPRPIDVSINQLGLGNSSGPSTAFVASTGNLPGARGDMLLVFNNLTQLLNKVPATTYFFRSTDNTWRSTASGFPLADSNTISGAVGFIIRKKATVGGATVFWTNQATW